MDTPHPTQDRPALLAVERQEAEGEKLYEDPLLLPAERKAIRKQAIIELIAEGCNHREAARGVGIDPSTLCRWRQQDPEFAKACTEAFRVSLEGMEREAERRALNGSDKLLMFLLERRAPEKYHIAQKMEHSGTVDLANAVLAGRKRIAAAEAVEPEPGEDLC